MIISFWNMNMNKDKNKNPDSIIIDLIEENHIDILILAEYNNSIEKLCEKLNGKRTKFKPLKCKEIGCDKITGLYTERFTHVPLFANTRYYISSFSTAYFYLIICMVHAPSNIHKSNDDRRAFFARVYKEIERVETEANTGNTIIVGDLNSNPFDSSVVAADALHAIPHKEESTKMTRKIDGNSYKMFYNPSWKLVALDKPPYGTFFYNNSNYVNYYWYLFDQVIIRPELIKAFNENSLKIVAKIKDTTLLKNEYKPDGQISDHLPIIFEIKEEKI